MSKRGKGADRGAVVDAYRWPRLLTFLALLLPLLMPRAEAQSLDSLDWMAGHWRCEREGSVTEEYWMPAAAGMMPGVNRTQGRDGRGMFEFLRIVQLDRSLLYIAMPGGRAETRFTFTAQRPGFVRFENVDHDFPQRIEYEREGPGIIIARISDASGANEMSWRFVRVVGIETK
ncbi:MAG TPA: DUF6265 family protein [Bacteroidota bacterium]|nr:DUF6265 family protein [Bacteroidota bacterium]